MYARSHGPQLHVGAGNHRYNYTWGTTWYIGLPSPLKEPYKHRHPKLCETISNPYNSEPLVKKPRTTTPLPLKVIQTN